MPGHSTLLEKEKEKQFPKLSADEQVYYGKLVSRLLKAKKDRDGKYPEFDNQTYLDQFKENERLANTFISTNGGEFKDRNGDIVISSGTVEQKLQTLVSEIIRLNLGAEVRAYDRDSNELNALGRALTDIIVKTEDWENDEEHKINRVTELLKQGTVFVQEQWIKDYRVKKNLKNRKDIGKVSGVDWSEKLELAFEGPQRRILHGPGVYLGNIKEYTMTRQPFVYTLNMTSYGEAKTRYGGQRDGKDIWERWKHVPKNVTNVLSEASQDLDQGFTLYQSKENQVEEIHYQDPMSNEFQILLNGVPMLPVGFPLSAVSPTGGLNIEKQILHTINPFFAYGRSFVARTRHFAGLIDEMLRLLMLKSRKSIHPPYANTSGKVISPKALMPARITMGIDPDALVPIGQEGQGVTAAEFNMLKELRDGLDRVTVSPQMEGQRGGAGATAFEVGLLQQQAQKLILLSIASATFLEQKLGKLRLDNILANFFTPQRTEYDEEKQTIKKVFRKVTAESNIEGRGQGSRQIIPVSSDEVPDSFSIMDQEDFEGTPESPDGGRRKTRQELRMKPIEKIFLNVDELKRRQNTFTVQVESRVKDTTQAARRLFREELQDLAALVNLGSKPNLEYLEGQHAQNWGKEKDKMFEQNVEEMMPQEGEEDPQREGAEKVQELLSSNQSGESTFEGEGGAT